MNSKATVAALTLAIPLAAMAQTSVEDQQSKIEKALENVLSKQGLSVGGLATGEYLKSDFSGSATDNSLRTTEPVTYTQVDFDLQARPNATTTARAVFRMHLDWPNFWPVCSTTEWVIRACAGPLIPSGLLMLASSTRRACSSRRSSKR